ncbi:hypothetical protein Tco_0308784 [Tanacetum coccineum]
MIYKYVVPIGRVKVPAVRRKDLSRAGPTSGIRAWREPLRKKTGRDPKGNIMILPPVSVEEHIAVQRETKARTILLQFQKILSQLNQMQAKPDNEDCNMKFLRALSTFWSRGAITLKQGGTFAPTHSAFISATSTNSKMSYPDQSHSTTFTSASTSPAASSNVIENVLHSFVAESDPQ